MIPFPSIRIYKNIRIQQWAIYGNHYITARIILTSRFRNIQCSLYIQKINICFKWYSERCRSYMAERVHQNNITNQFYMRYIELQRLTKNRIEIFSNWVLLHPLITNRPRMGVFGCMVCNGHEHSSNNMDTKWDGGGAVYDWRYLGLIKHNKAK